MNAQRQRFGHASIRALLLGALCVASASGCYAPLHSYDIPASTLPDTFRAPVRTMGEPLNFASLTIPAPPEYILGPNDILEVTIHGLYPDAEVRPVRAQILGDGTVVLPLVGSVHVGGLNVGQAHEAISNAFDPEFIKDSRINVYLVERSTTSVLVLGEVTMPGVYRLPKYENDVGHAIAIAGGLTIDAGTELEVHRRIPLEQAQQAALINELQQGEPGATVTLPDAVDEHLQDAASLPGGHEPVRIIRIPMRGLPPEAVYPNDVVLSPGDVVVVPSRKHEVFYVVGKLSPTNFTRFNIGARERDLGAGFLLPRDRDIDVVTAVAMAGYIDPIDSPTTVTVHRICPNGEPMLIRVDLIAARYDRRETIMVQAGDIIYLNPDAAWWTRRTLDRLIEPILTLSFRKWIGLGGAN